MKKICLKGIVLISIFLIAGCQLSRGNKESAFLEIFPGVEFNNDINLVEYPISKNSGYIGDEVDLILVNQSNTTITFQISKDVSIYAYSEKSQKWLMVENQFKYKAGEHTLQPSGSGLKTDTLVLVWPEIYDYNTPIEIRIVAIGHKNISENKIIDTGAYYDIKLVPFE